MSFDQLKNHILAEARQKAQRMTDELGRQRQEHERRIAETARAAEQAIIERAMAEAKGQAQRLRQAGDLKAKAHILSGKQSALDELSQAFRTQLLQLSEKDTKAIIEGLLAGIPAQSEGRIIPGELQADIVKAVGRRRECTVSDETIPDEGGFIFRGARHEYNFTTSHLVQQLFSRHRARLARILFS